MFSVSSSYNNETAIDTVHNSPSTISTDVVVEKSNSTNKEGTTQDESKAEKEEQDPFADFLPLDEAKILRKPFELPKI